MPRARVLRDYALALLHGIAPQLDRRDLRRVLEGNLEPRWPQAPAGGTESADHDLRLAGGHPTGSSSGASRIRGERQSV